MLKPLLRQLGGKMLIQLTAAGIRGALLSFAATHSTDTVSIARLGLERAIRHAEANDLISRNVAALGMRRKDGHGRPSKSLSLNQATAIIEASRQERTTREFPGLPRRPRH